MKQLFTSAFLFSVSAYVFAFSGETALIKVVEDVERWTVRPAENFSQYEICGLTPGANYWVYLNGQEGDKSGLKKSGPFANTGKWPGSLYLEKATSCVKISMWVSRPTAGYWLSVIRQDVPEAIAAPKLLAGISASANGDPQFLIQNVFIGGGCFDVSNTTSGGTSSQIGTFGNGASSINISNGVILSTGNVVNAAGPNNSPSMSSGFGNAGNDPDLAVLVDNGQLFDVAVIEFDFTPTVAQVSFEYAFASEEYCEFAGSTFNDVFGFFISGPGINGPFSNNADNIALIPGSGNPVAINSVNHFSNTAYYHDNNPPGQSPGCNTGEAAATGTIAYDGFTVVFTAIADVIPCQTYHIKLAIADRGDSAYDSAVFLKANSFNAGTSSTQITPSISGVAFSDDTAYEQCGDGVFTFVRDNSFISEPFEFHFIVSGSSTATPGLDYVVFPTTVLFAPGQTTLQLPVEILADNLDEGTESIILEYDNPCSCFPQTIEIFIYDPPELDIFVADEFVCQGIGTTLTPQVSGGAPDYTFAWSNGTSGPDFTLTPPAGTSTWTVTVTDACGVQAVTDFQIESYKPSAIIDGQGAICDGNNTAFVEVAFTGEGPYTITYVVNGFSTTLNNLTDNPSLIPVQDIGTVVLTGASANGCPANVFGDAQVTWTEVEANPVISPISCYGLVDGAIDLQISGGAEPYDITWDNNLGPGEDQQGLEAGDYNVTVVDANGCLAFAEATLLPPPVFLVDVVGVNHVDCNHPTGSIDVQIQGGSGNLVYNWSNGAFQEDLTGVGPGYYDLTVYDQMGCQAAAGAAISNNISYPNAVVANGLVIDCLHPSAQISGQGSSQGANITYQWLDGNGAPIPGANSRDLQVNTPGAYTLVVTNTGNGCSREDNTLVLADTDFPLADAGQDGMITCQTPGLNLDGSGSDQGPGLVFQWTTAGGNILSGADSATPSVNAGGIYFLNLTNINNGCTSSDTVIVQANQDYPLIQIEAPDVINCFEPIAHLDAGASLAGNYYSVVWTTSDGHFSGPSDVLLATADAPGTYTITLTNLENGCQSGSSVLILEDFDYPVADAGPSAELSCLTSSALLDGTGSSSGPEFVYAWSSSDGQVNSGQNGLNPNVNAPGTYVLSVTDTSNGCISRDSVMITENSNSPAIFAEAQGILTCDNASVVLDGAGSDSGVGFEALWTGPAGNPIDHADSLNATVYHPGVYTLSITNLINSCVSSLNVSVMQDTLAPLVSAGPDQTLTCFEPSVALDGSASGQGPELLLNWSAVAGAISGDSTQAVVSVAEAGLYILRIFNQSNGCENADSVRVLADQFRPLADAGLDSELNCASPVYHLTGSAADTGPGFEFSWVDLTNGNPVQPVLDPVFSVDGVYEMRVFNQDNGCESRDTLRITANFNRPEADISGIETLTCRDTVIALSALVSGPSAVLQYTWTTVDGHFAGIQQGPDAMVDQPGVYMLIVSDLESFCADTAFTQIGLNTDLPQVVITPPSIITCSQPEVLLNAAGSSSGPDYEYVWTTTGGQFAGPPAGLSAMAGSPGDYTLEILNTINGCTNQGSVLVERDPNIPEADAGTGQVITCNTPEVPIGGQSSSAGPGIVYAWEILGEGALTVLDQPNTLAQAPGIYVLSVLNQNNDCAAFDTVSVAIDTLSPVAQAGQDFVLTCNQTSVALGAEGSSTGSDFSYSWKKNGVDLAQNLLNLTVNASGTYELEVTNLLTGCRSSDFAYVATDTLHPEVSIDPPGVLNCIQPQLTLSALAQGNYPVTWEWSTSDGHILAGETSFQAQVDADGFYALRVTNPENGCFIMTGVSVSIDTLKPLVQIAPPGILDCRQTTVILDAGANPQDGYLYEWSTAQGNILNGGQSSAATVNLKGVYDLKVLNPDNGCESTSSVIVEENVDLPQLAIDPPPVLTCLVEELLLEAQTGQGAETWLLTWSGPGGISGSSIQLAVDQPGTYRLTALNPENQCENWAEATVEQDIEQPVADAGPSGVLDCHSEEIGLNGQNSSQGTEFVYSWATDNGMLLTGAHSLTPLVNGPGVYRLTVENLQNGCTASDLVTVSAIPPVEAEISTFPPLCYGDPATIQVNSPSGGMAPYLFSVDGGAHFQSNPAFTGLAAGIYEVAVQDASGCEYRQSIAIEQPGELEVALQPQILAGLGDEVTLQALVNVDTSLISSIEWRPAERLSCTNCLDPRVEAISTTVYSISVETLNGCKAGAKTQLIVDRNVDVFIPNGFTPNNIDGNNDRLVIFAKPGQVNRIKSFLIFNRWGENVFEVYNFPPNDPLYGWDGTHRGQPLDPAVFVYLAEIELADGQTLLLKGDVTLVR